MNTPSETPPAKRKEVKGNAIPTRFDPAEEEAIEQIAEETKLDKSEIIRRACQLALPRFLSRLVDIARIPPPTAAIPGSTLNTHRRS